VALIATVQRRGAELQSAEYVPYGVAFDVEKLTWEMDFFIKHFIEAYRGVVIAPAAREALRDELAVVIEELAAEHRVLCHRDYHSRNLMYHDERLYIIDFQDARMGPDTYDLVSLLRDSYVDLPEQTVGELMAYFLALKGEPDQEEAFRVRFDLMALQRNLKALGTFGYQTTARRNPVYIQYIPRTLRYVRDNLARHERFSRLHDVLAAHVEEFH
jgi:aminoglycoside/choline kinase family phosphotransferase